MRAGVSTSCLFPMLIEEALDHLLSMGIRTVEVFLNTESERVPAFARLLREKADAAGAQIVSVHPYSSEYEGIRFFTKYPRRYLDSIEDYRRYFEFCNIVGAKILVFHGLREFIPAAHALYFERFAGLMQVGRQYGVEVCQENVARFYSGKAQFLAEMIRAIPDAGLVIDLKQALRAGEEPMEMLRLAGKNLRHVHVSDHDSAHDCLAPGTGEADFAQMAGILRGAGYQGDVIIELYRSNYGEEEQLAKSCRFLQSIS